MFCEKCGSSISDGAAFCSACGNRVASAAQSTGTSSAFGGASGAQPPIGNWQTGQGNPASGGNQKKNVPWKFIAIIGGIAVLLIAVIVLIVVLVSDSGGSSSRSRDKEDDIEEDDDSDRRSSRSRNKEDDAVEENEKLLLGEWVSRKDTTIGSDFAVLMIDAIIDSYDKIDSDLADLLEYYYEAYSADELLEELELDERTEIQLVFEKNGDLRVKMYDEWADDDDGYFTYRVMDEETIRLTCRMWDEDLDINISFSYEAEYEVDEDSLSLDFFGNIIKFDRD